VGSNPTLSAGSGPCFCRAPTSLATAGHPTHPAEPIDPGQGGRTGPMLRLPFAGGVVGAAGPPRRHSAFLAASPATIATCAPQRCTTRVGGRRARAASGPQFVQMTTAQVVNRTIWPRWGARCDHADRLGDGGSRALHCPFAPPALVAQLDRASDYGSEGWGFESLRARCPNPLVQRACRV
jgi:hypothetical protein